ncbi:hypothetical protein WDW37_10520 [Bdellovibrionota bacterium FG-1]
MDQVIRKTTTTIETAAPPTPSDAYSDSQSERLTEGLERWAPLFFYFVLAALSAFVLFHTVPALADGRLPGEDISAKMESAGTLLRFVDTGIFKWTARVLAGLCIFGAGWSLKEMRFGPAVISMIAAILFGTAPTWVKNIFSIGGADSVFSMQERETGNARLALLRDRGRTDA